jgi:hypothetical protein
MSATLDIEKSIDKKRLIYKGSFWDLFSVYFTSYCNGISTILIFSFLLALMTNERHFPIIFTFLFLFFVTCSTVNLFFINRLFVAEGPDNNFYRANVIKRLQNNYKKIKIDSLDDRLLIAKTESFFWAFDRTFVTMFDDKTIAMNISVFGRGNLKYSFVAIPNYFKCKALLKGISK